VSDAAIAKAREEIAKLPGIKESAIAHLGPCVICGKPLLAELMFYRIKIERAGFEPRAIERRAGMALLMGNQTLARVMGPDEDLAKIISGPREVAVHEGCAGKVYHLLALFEEGS